MPPGVINMLPGDGLDVSAVALEHPDLAGIHFTGSTPTFQHLWRTVGENITGYRAYPRIVGETGGKDFVVAHPSADPDVLRIGADPRRLRVPGPEVLGRLPRVRRRARCGSGCKDDLVAETEAIAMGDVTDLSNFMGAVIDDRAFAKHEQGDHPRQAVTEAHGARRRQGRRLGRAGSSGRRSSSPSTPTTRCSAPSTSGRSSRCTSTRTATSRRSSTRWSRSRRTR